MSYGYGYDDQQQQPPQQQQAYPADDGNSAGGPLTSKKSFTGPQTDDDRQQSLQRRKSSMRYQSMRSMGSVGGNAQDGLARNGSKFQINRQRETQESISMHGAMDDNEMDVEDLKQYYGDMAAREERSKHDGVSVVKTYRGHIEDGDDVGMPRRVLTRRNLGATAATGYGGINFKRQVAMRRGEQWGEMDIRRRGGVKKNDRNIEVNQKREQLARSEQQHAPPMQYPMYMPPPPPPMEMPVQPLVYNQEEVRTYSGLMDAFAEGANPDDRGDDF